MSEWSQNLTLSQNVNWGFLLRTTLPTSGVVIQPHYIQMFSQGVISGKEASNNPGFCPKNDSNRAFVARLGPEINFPACLCVLPGPRHITKCWLFTRHLILFLIFRLETPGTV